MLLSQTDEDNKKRKPKPPEPDCKIEGYIINSISKDKTSNKSLKEVITVEKD